MKHNLFHSRSGFAEEEIIKKQLKNKKIELNFNEGEFP
jgi:thioredoxin reductase